MSGVQSIDIRDNPFFQQQLRFLKESEFWPEKEIKDFQLRQLKELLIHCKKNVPYYRELFSKQGIDPEIFTSVTDIRKIPYLTKEIIKSRPGDFIAEDFDPADLFYMTTGGSTGKPLKIMMDKKFKAFNHAATYYYMDIAGFNPHDFRSIRLHGNTLDQNLIDRQIYWFLENPKKMIMSSYHISERTAPAYVSEINRHNPDYIHAFPSTIFLLAQYIQKMDLPVTANVSSVFCDCEVLYDYQRSLIEEVFSAKVYSIYAHTEGAVYGITCRESNKLHLLPQIGITELLDGEGNDIITPGQKGEIVVTGFTNRVFPVVRYRTSDIGISTVQGCSCGRNYFLLENVEGRLQDYIIDNQQRIVPLAPALFDYNFDWSGIDRFRVYQDTPGYLTFRFVPETAERPNADTIAKRLEREFARILNYGFVIRAEKIDILEPTKKGKYRYLEQKLPVTGCCIH